MAKNDIAFVTGATGFVGMAVLARVLEHTDRDVVVLVRAASRTKEMSVRYAMGATSWQVVRQLLIEGLLRGIAETAAGDAGVQYALASSDAQAARSEAQAEQDELIAVIAELIERARRAGTIRPGIEATDIAMLICGVVSAMGPRPGFDWRRHLDLVTDTLRVR